MNENYYTFVLESLSCIQQFSGYFFRSYDFLSFSLLYRLSHFHQHDLSTFFWNSSPENSTHLSTCYLIFTDNYCSPLMFYLYSSLRIVLGSLYTFLILFAFSLFISASIPVCSSHSVGSDISADEILWLGIQYLLHGPINTVAGTNYHTVRETHICRCRALPRS